MDSTMLGFLDLETTGHDPLRRTQLENGRWPVESWHEIIDIGCVFVRTPGLTIIGEFQTLVRPYSPSRCDPKTEPITNFSQRWAKGEWDDAPYLNAAIHLLLNNCRKYAGKDAVIVLGGQNFFFDWSFLSVAFAKLGITDEEYAQYFHHKKFDVSSIAIQELWDPKTSLDMQQFSLRSGLLQKQLGIEPEPLPHRAINGARQAYLTFKKLTEKK